MSLTDSIDSVELKSIVDRIISHIESSVMPTTSVPKVIPTLTPIVFNPKSDQFRVWKLKVKSYLESVELDNEIKVNKTESEPSVNKKVRVFILLSLDNETLTALTDSISDDTTAHQVWDLVCKYHEKESPSSVLLLKNQFVSDKLRNNERVTDYINRLINVNSQLKLVKDGYSDSDLVFYLLKGVSSHHKYESMCNIIRYQEGNTFVKVCDKLKDFEIQQSMLSSSKSESVNYVNKSSNQHNNKYNNNNSKGNHCHFCKKKGHAWDDCDKRKKQLCFKCNKPGHISKKCPDNNISSSNNINTSNSSNNSNNNNNNSNSNTALVISSVNNINVQSNDWVIDSGCSTHFCNDIKLFKNIRNEESTVTVANNELVNISKVGDVELISNLNNRLVTLKDVKYSPNFAHNLISVSHMNQNNAIVSFKNGESIINHNGIVLMKGINKNGLYYLQCHSKYQYDKVLEVNDNNKLSQIELIHNRLGHIGNTGMKQLVNKQAVSGVESIKLNELNKCDTCSIGKAHRDAFGNTSSREKASTPLYRLHCDLSSFIHRNEQKYVSVIIDEYSRLASIKILKYKSETIDHIKNWIDENENKLSVKVKEFHSDGGGEYTSSELKDYFISKGIRNTITCKGTPQHNGIAERYNRTLFNTARCLLQQSKLSLEFSEYAIRTASYLLEFRLSVTDKSKTAYELFYSKKPSISHLRVFGCDSFVHTSENSKLEARASRGIFVGYSDYNINGYEILLIEENKLITSRDVMFEENKFTFGIRMTEIRMNELYQLDYNSVVTVPGNDNFNSVYQNQDELNYNDEFDDYIPNNNNSINTSNIVPVSISNEPRRNPPRARQQPNRLGFHNENDFDPDDRATINSNNVMNVNELSINDPLTVQQALKSDNADKWKIAMNEEIEQLIINNTWSLVELPPDRKAVSNKWVFKTKLNSDGTIERFKARLCAKGFTQVQFIDFNDTYAPVMKYKSLRIILALATILNYDIQHLDVQTAFLNATLKEEVYMKQPEYYEVKSKSGKELVCKLNKSIYGLKQASNEWNKEVSNTIISFGFIQCKSDICVYMKYSKNSNLIILAIFVDDIIVIHSPSDNDEWSDLKNKFMMKYSIKDYKNANFILGMKIERGVNSLKISQELQVNKTLKQFQFDSIRFKSTPSETSAKLSEIDSPSSDEEKGKMKSIPYMSLVGNVLYLSICTRPDISFSVNQVSRFMKNPGEKHWIAGKRILRYLASTSDLGLHYQNDRTDGMIVLIGYCDADWAGDIDDRRSTTGYAIKLNGCLINWLSKKQDTVALSSAEAEYIAISDTVKEMKWIKSLLAELKLLSDTIPILYCDNQSAIAISETDKHHNRTKHIDIRHHFIRDYIKNKIIKLKWIESSEQQADILTKSLGKPLFEKLRLMIMNDK